MKLLFTIAIIILIIYWYCKRNRQSPINNAVATSGIIPVSPNSTVNAVSNITIQPTVVTSVSSPVAEINNQLVSPTKPLIQNSIPIQQAPLPVALSPNALAPTQGLIEKAAVNTLSSDIAKNIAIGVSTEKAMGDYTGFGVPLTPTTPGLLDASGSDSLNNLQLAPDIQIAPTFETSLYLPEGWGSGDIGFGGGPLAG